MTTKYKIMLSALATGRMVRVTFTPATEGVVLPDHLLEQILVGLDFGCFAPTAITDLECTPAAISGTLRFGAEYFWCSVPWVAVVSINPIGPTQAQRAWNPTIIQGEN